MGEPRNGPPPLPSAGEDLRQGASSSRTLRRRARRRYRLAFADQEFLLREELRPVRLQLELMKPDCC